MQPHAVSETLSADFLASLQCAATQQLPAAELCGRADHFVARGLSDYSQELYRVWIQHNPADPLLPIVLFNYGTLLLNGGILPTAEAAFRAAIRLRPDFLFAYLNLGATLQAQGETAQALAQWLTIVNHQTVVSRETVALKAMALKRIAQLRLVEQDHEQAEEALRQSLDLNPAQHDVAVHWIAVRQEQCKWPVVAPRADTPFSALTDIMAPLSLARHADTPMFQLALGHVCYRREVEREPAIHTVGTWPPPQTPRPQRLRIGYVCSGMRADALGSLLVGMFALHDRTRFEVFGYYTGPDVRDPIRTRTENSFEHWRDIAKLSDKQASAVIVGDRIDILIDLNGHTDGGRAQLFALRPAPIIVNWLGYPGSMGTPHHQYILADERIIPPSLERYYSEAVRRLPCYQPNDRARRLADHTPSRAEAGLPEAAFVYCCFNSTAKITPLIFQCWMKILLQVPHAVLWLLSSSDAINTRLRQAAAQAGVAPERLVFAPRQSHPEHLVRYRAADLFLDTFPYGAHTTASDALWLGLPVVTLCGNAFASRVCGSLVRSTGLAELACDTAEAYVQTAVKLGQDSAALHKCRQTLLTERDRCALFDTKGLVNSLETIFDGMWDDYALDRLPVPDLTNLDAYAEIGAEEPYETVDVLGLDQYEQYYRTAMAYRSARSPLPHDHRLWSRDTAASTTA